MEPKLPIEVVPRVEWVPRWVRVAYLIIGPEIEERWSELASVRPTEAFQQFVNGQVSALVNEGTAPPDEIAPAILNLADDMLAGQPMTLRAGDYIAIQNYLHQR